MSVLSDERACATALTGKAPELAGSAWHHEQANRTSACGRPACVRSPRMQAIVGEKSNGRCNTCPNRAMLEGLHSGGLRVTLCRGLPIPVREKVIGADIHRPELLQQQAMTRRCQCR